MPPVFGFYYSGGPKVRQGPPAGWVAGRAPLWYNTEKMGKGGGGMLLLFGAGPGTEDLYLDQKIVCPVCGKKATLQAYCSYDAWRLFFIPVHKYNRRYFVRTSCCGAGCDIPAALGQAIDEGERDTLPLAGLPLHGGLALTRLKVCARCGYETSQPFRYCPMCGKKFGR